MDFNYKNLEELRKNTRLNLIEKLKLIKLRNQAIDDWNTINRVEHCHLGVDFREADQFEFEKRLSRYNRKMRGKYGYYY